MLNVKIINNMEIKVGDKVRVSKDAPEMYFFGCNYDNSVCKVILVDRDNAVITQVKNGSFAIPTKYLIKVEDGAKEPEYRKGDKVRYIGYMQPTYKGKAFVIDGNVFFNDHFNEWQASSIKPFMWDGLSVCNVPLSDLEPYTEPTEEANLQDATASELRDLANHGVSVGDEVKRRIKERKEEPHLKKEAKEWADTVSDAINEYGDAMCKIYADAQSEAYWTSYTADLAKEIALKLVNKKMDNDPQGIAEYAITVAEAVVAGLKKK